MIQADKQFKELFGFEPPYSEVILVQKGISLNLFKLEELLKEADPRFNSDDYDESSVLIFIKENYGNHALKIIYELLKIK